MNKIANLCFFAWLLITSRCNVQSQNYSVTIQDTVQTKFRGFAPDKSKLIVFLGPGFDKDSIAVYINDKLFEKRLIEINYSVAVDEVNISNTNDIHMMGISVNNGNIINIKPKPQIYVMRIDLDKEQRILKVVYMDKIPFYD